MIDLGFEKEFTRVHRLMEGQGAARREAACLRVMYPLLCPNMQQEDLFAGRTLRMEYRGVGLSPDITLYGQPHGMGYFYREDVFVEALERADEAEAAQIREMMAYWREQNTTAKVKAQFTQRIR